MIPNMKRKEKLGSAHFLMSRCREACQQVRSCFHYQADQCENNIQEKGQTCFSDDKGGRVSSSGVHMILKN